MGGFIRITGCTSPVHKLIIPDSIAGLPVKQIGDYAFRGMDILEEAVLPAGITRIGDHVFYNCLRLKELSFWDGITFVGDGAFKNCDHLESMTFYSRNHHPSSLRRMLTDVMQDITVDYYYMEDQAADYADPAQAKAQARLMFPAFYFDYIENYPARIFEEVIYGTGQAYRQCFRKADLDYAAYDRLFERSVREDHAATVLQTAVGRLLYPRSLT
ncbi:MAG: leucine-rich repeat domain-containing protein, partial [Lachnospiraceae bacterium]